MGIMWRKKSATARTVYTLLKARHSITRPTVTAVMSSLCKRGLLKKTISKGRGGLRYVFKVQISRRRFEREVVGKVVDSLLESYKKTAKKQMREKLKQV